MNSLTLQQNNLPSTLEDLSQFVLVGREKLTSVRAEIRAIDKLNLAQEVRDQKKEECLMLSEALLDAEVKLGDLLKQIPKTSGGDRKSIKIKNDSGVDFENKKPKPEIKYSSSGWPLCGPSCDYWKDGICKLRCDLKVGEGGTCCEHTAAKCNQKPKHEVIKDLGFNQKQAERFETLANNKDLVEVVKAEARENDDIPTRTRVLELAKARKQKQQEETEKEESYDQYMEQCKKTADKFNDILYDLNGLDVEDKNLEEWGELLDKNLINTYLEVARNDFHKIIVIQKFLTMKGVKK
ncbi:MAG: hypothetical protein WCQ54_10775 [Clostridiaceae bacterium]